MLLGFQAQGAIEDQRLDRDLRESQKRSFLVGSYKTRKRNKGVMIGVGFGQWKLLDYSPNYNLKEFTEVYNETSILNYQELSSNLEVNIQNYSYGMNVTLGRGAYHGKQEEEKSVSDLTLYQFRGAGTVAWKAKEQLHFYANLGAYAVFYKETQNKVYFHGLTTPSLFVSLGTRVSISGIDLARSVKNYFEYGLKDIFLYLEGTMLFYSLEPRDPVFQSYGVSLGLKFEL